MKTRELLIMLLRYYSIPFDVLIKWLHERAADPDRIPQHCDNLRERDIYIILNDVIISLISEDPELWKA